MKSKNFNGLLGNKKWFVLVGILVTVLFVIEVVDSFLSYQGLNILTFGFVLDVILNVILKSGYTIILGAIPLFLITGLLYFLLKHLLKKLHKKEMNLIMIIIISVVFGMFVVPYIYSPLEQKGIEDNLYPKFVQDSFEKSHPDDPITSTLALIVYGSGLGLFIGIIISLMYFVLKNKPKNNYGTSSFLLIFIVTLLLLPIVYTSGWYRGSISTHQHTGFSAETLYDGVEGQGGMDYE